MKHHYYTCSDVNMKRRYTLAVTSTRSIITYDRMEKVCTFTIYGKMTLLVTAVGFD